MLQVAKSGRHVLLSVESLVGSTRRFSDSIYDLHREVGMEEIQGAIALAIYTALPLPAVIIAACTVGRI